MRIDLNQASASQIASEPSSKPVSTQSVMSLTMLLRIEPLFPLPATSQPAGEHCHELT